MTRAMTRATTRATGHPPAEARPAGGAFTRSDRPAGRSDAEARRRSVAGDGLLVAALEACALQHLLVLLLAHALTALLDQRTHEEATLPPRPARCQPRWSFPPWSSRRGGGVHPGATSLTPLGACCFMKPNR